MFNILNILEFLKQKLTGFEFSDYEITGSTAYKILYKILFLAGPSDGIQLLWRYIVPSTASHISNLLIL